MEWVFSEVYGFKKIMYAHTYLSTCVQGCMNIYLPLSYLSNRPVFSELETGWLDGLL